MSHSERQRPNVLSYPIQSRHASRLGEGTGAEVDGNLLEEQWRRPDPEIMTGQAEGGEIFSRETGEKGIAGSVGPPELEEGRGRGRWRGHGDAARRGNNEKVALQPWMSDIALGMRRDREKLHTVSSRRFDCVLFPITRKIQSSRLIMFNSMAHMTVANS